MTNSEDNEVTIDDPHDAKASPGNVGPDADVIQSQTLPSGSLPHIVPAQPIPVATSSAQSDEVPTAFPRIEGYHIIAKLGQGGMGAVYRATQDSTKREVALKLMSGRTIGSDKARRRFEREVELASSLEHPNIARVYDSGLNKGVYFYAMRLIPGVPLDKFVEMNQLDERHILELFLKICRAVEFAHRKGVIHRDLKPSNIMVTPTPESEPFVVDFGLAKTLIDDGEHLTVSQEGDLTGTPAYMSPEQAAGHVRSVDTRTDVYALGVILFRLLTNDHPHDTTGSAFDLTKRIIELDPKRPRNIKADLSRDLEAILLKCLEKQPANRYGSAGGLADDIQRYLNREPVTAQPATASYFLKKKLARNKPLVALAATLFVLFNAAVLFYFMSMKAEQARTEQARLDAVAQEGFAKVSEAKAVEEAGRATKAEVVAQKERDTAKAQTEETRRQLYFNQIGLAHAEQQQGNLSRADEILDECAVDLRHWEWYYLRRLCHIEPRVFGGHEPIVQAVAWSNDGRWIVASSGTKILVRDARSGKVITTYAEHTGEISLIRLFPDSLRAATASHDKTVRVWNLQTGQTEKVHDFDDAPLALDVSAEGSRLAAGTQKGPVRIWDTLTWQVQAELPVGVAAVFMHAAVAFSPDRKILAVCSNSDNNKLQLWDLTSEKPTIKRQIGSRGGHDLMFTSDGGTIIETDQQGRMRSWNCDSGALVYDQLVQFKHAFGTLSLDRTTVATTYWNSVKIHDAATGRMLTNLRVIGGHNMRCVALSPDGSEVAVGFYDKLMIWPTRGGRLYSSPDASDGFSGPLALSPDGQWLAGWMRDRVGLWHLATPSFSRAIATTNHYQFGLAFTPDSGQLVFTGDHGKLFWYDVVSGAQTRVVDESKQGAISGLAMEPRGGMSVRFKDGVQYRREEAGSPGWRYASKRTGGAMAFNHRGDLMAIVNVGNAVELVNTADGQLVRRVVVDGNTLVASFSPDDRWVALGTSSADGLHLVDAETGQLQWSRRDHQGGVQTVDWSPDGRRLVTGSMDGTLKLWDAASGRPILTLRHDGHVAGVAFTPDGSRIVSSGDGATAIRIWHGSPVKLPLDKPVDLLALLDGQDDSVTGQWRIENGRLQNVEAATAQITFPLTCHGDYDLDLVFRRAEGLNSFNVHLPVGGRTVRLGIDGWNHIAGLDAIDGRGGGNPTNPTRSNVTLTNGRDYHLRVRVKVDDDRKRATIIATLDDGPLLNWTGNLDALSDGRPLPTNNVFGFDVWESQYVVSQAALTPRSGEALLLGDRKSSGPPGWRVAKLGEQVDLLANVDLQRDAVKGEWSKEDNGLRIRPVLEGRLAFRANPRGSYRVKAEFLRKQGEQGPVLILPAGKRRILLVISAMTQEKISGLYQIDGKIPQENGTAVKTLLDDGKLYVVDATVTVSGTKIAIEATLDGKPLIKWSGEEGSLEIPAIWALPRSDLVGVGASDSDIVFKRWTLQMLDGEAWVRQPADAVKPEEKK